ncbi:MAG TPA: SEC-C metal-binding domain-containing protein [Phycisphaerae bacterium]|nr:SEC-C metal-binding domain-containing protein [Phycisphaerae bacterium]
MNADDIYRATVEAAFEFDARRLWERFGGEDCFVVRAPGEASPMVGAIMGEGGEEFGLTLFRGEEAAACFRGLHDPLGPGDDLTERLDVLGFSMGPFGEMPPDSQALLRKAVGKPKKGDILPQFIAKPSGRLPRLPNTRELRTLLVALRGILEADRQGKMRPPRPTGDRVLSLALTDDPDQPLDSVGREELPATAMPRQPASDLDADLSGLPLLEETWLAGLLTIPARIEGDDRSLQLLLIVDNESELVLDARPVFVDETAKAAEVMLSAFQRRGPSGRAGLPEEILFSSQSLHDAVAPAVEPLGVECVYLPTIPKLLKIASEFLGGLEADLPSLSPHLGAEDDLPVPQPDDLAGWKEVDRRLACRFADHLDNEDRLWSSRAANRYFGDDDLERFFDAHKDRSVVQAYASWGVLSYRPTKNSKTQAEKMLAKGLPKAQAVVLQARLRAHPTLYRIASHDAGAGTVAMEDVLLGGTVTVHDKLFSENVNDGIFLPGRAFRAGRFHFLEPVGPPLGAGMGIEAVEFLQDCGMEVTPEGLDRDTHLFGRLWRWLDDWEANRKPPHLCNTDGDDFLWHTASFALADAGAVRREMLKRDDIEQDEDGDELIWLRPGPSMIGGPIHLARMEFLGDELVLTVNSAKRFGKARRWIEKLPGVRFLNVTTRRWDEPDEDRPLDERLSRPEPVEMTPELTASVQEMITTHYMSWLDEPLPMLGGKTPRHTCKSAAGRQKVAMLIRTMPDPMGSADVQVPRQAMLRELGIEASAPPPDQPSVDGSYAPSAPAGLSRDKTGRNGPCPCGSGKKYKKCCGR